MKTAFKEILKFPFARKGSWKTILAAMFFSLVPIFNFLTVGFIMEIYRKGIFKEPLELPVWGNDHLHYLKQGFFVALIGLVLLVPVMLSILMAGAVFLIYPPAGFLFVVMTVVSVFVLAFIAPFVWGHYLETGEYRGVFNWKKLKGKLDLCFRDYLRVFSLALITLIILSSLVNILYKVQVFVGMVAYLFIVVYSGIVVMRLFGEIYPYDAKDAAPASACTIVGDDGSDVVEDVSVSSSQESVHEEDSDEDSPKPSDA